jgi:hypothetical protein
MISKGGYRLFNYLGQQCLRIEDFNRKSTKGARMVPHYQEGVWNFWEHLFHLGFHQW